MKEATGRALFENRDWEDSDVDSDDEDGAGGFNLEALRRETEAARQKKEEERLAALGMGPDGETLENGADKNGY